ncbi:hypothetical protein NA56DRAFT_2578 [Hyaloscypha hepaticicola]|uniref:Uncharacterized protein n=1 Tax=Hyaloscypha hepaticicola TaxID=2082293 RepID=A0A2J6QPG5_9HELO|nr:hypothetical protein NA56DRAFT_2578 [Hyaloscypha hepaticicola]
MGRQTRQRSNGPLISYEPRCEVRSHRTSRKNYQMIPITYPCHISHTMHVPNFRKHWGQFKDILISLSRMQQDRELREICCWCNTVSIPEDHTLRTIRKMVAQYASLLTGSDPRISPLEAKKRGSTKLVLASALLHNVIGIYVNTFSVKVSPAQCYIILYFGLLSVQLA